MRANGGYATLGHLYEEVMKLPDVKRTTKTPFKSINRVLQESKKFFRVRPGLWALVEAKDTFPPELAGRPKPETDHTYYQGLLVQLGNLRRLDTFVPKQDRGRTFLGQPLGAAATLEKILPFTYEEIVRRAANVDVIWFNDRKFPAEFIEVENTTDMLGAFLKFVIFDAFNSTFRIVAPAARKLEFASKLVHPSFKSVAPRTKFTSYETVVDWHTKLSAARAVEAQWEQ